MLKDIINDVCACGTAVRPVCMMQGTIACQIASSCHLSYICHWWIRHRLYGATLDGLGLASYSCPILWNYHMFSQYCVLLPILWNYIAHIFNNVCCFAWFIKAWLFALDNNKQYAVLRRWSAGNGCSALAAVLSLKPNILPRKERPQCFLRSLFDHVNTQLWQYVGTIPPGK